MNTEHLFCDTPGCGRFVFGRHDDTEDTVRRRAVVERGWMVFEHRDLCNVCRRRVDQLQVSE